ncbi:MAG TPA: zf-TFIIB domain-containing protein [Dehalococcoidales bacterium]
MLCPNDNGEMHQVKIESHYGQPIFLEQCEKCGGIWFDQSELYRAKQGEAEKIELLDAESLRSPALIENSKLVCPRDKTELVRFNDKNFPQGIILERCPKCDGFWLNRGEFTKYQKTRERMLHPEVVIIDDTQMDNNIRELVRLHGSGNRNDTLKRLANFLSTPVDDVFSSESGKRSPIEDKTATILNVITTIFRLFLFR